MVYEQLRIVLKNVGIPDKLVRLIMMCNEQTYFKVRLLGELSIIFKSKTELRQVVALFPTLFNLDLEKVMRDIPDLKEMETVGPYTLLVYLDDIILLGEFKYDIEENAKKLMKSSYNM
ncbi:Reverse transcriptase domain [Cinara cedri]|uniref:Reverse transcriptase domain n=1 Tax=Cinara cedri TaxID=506608 RepID=A0A5E4MLS2_9HEMI|nr:Reverse transcriptase domain [Cinara cedri]